MPEISRKISRSLARGLSPVFGRRGGGVGKIPVVTTGAETLTLGRVDVATGKVITIDWGDGSTNTYTDAVNGSTKTHAYPGAGSYELKITDARNIKEVDFRDAKIVSFNSSFFKACGDNLEGVSLLNTLTTPAVDSADMAHLNLSSQLFLFFTQPGTYTINSDHFKAYTLSSQLFLYFPQSGTYTINSDHFKAYTLSSRLYLHFSQSGTYTINSDHFKAYTLSYQLYLHFSQSGTYTINSDHFKAYTLSYRLYLHFSQSGTYTINSDHFKTYTLSFHLYLFFSKSGTYTINSDHFKAYTLSSQLYLYFPQSGTYTINSDHFKAYTLSSQLFLYFNTTSLIKTITATDFNEFTALPNVGIKMGLTSTEVDNILLGLYGAFPSKTNVGGTIDLADNGNAAPSGTYQSRCPPTTGKEAAYELINDSCGVSANHWASITVEGGLP